MGTRAALRAGVLTLLLAASLHGLPVVDLQPQPLDQVGQPVTRESIHRADRLGRSFVMVGASVVGMASAAALGGVIGMLTAGGGDFAAFAGLLVGTSLGGIAGVLLAPLFVWGLGRAMGGHGSLGATYLGAALGLAVAALGFTAWALGPGASPYTLIMFGILVPAGLVGAPWAFEISDAVRVTPTLNGALVTF